MSAPLRWRLVVGLLLVFIAGLVLGCFFGANRARRHWLDYTHHGALAARVRSRMESRLDLTPEQVKQTAPIFDATGRKLEQIREETSQRVRETFAEVDRQLAPRLTEAQRAKMENLEAKHQPDQRPRDEAPEP